MTQFYVEFEKMCSGTETDLQESKVIIVVVNRITILLIKYSLMVESVNWKYRESTKQNSSNSPGKVAGQNHKSKGFYCIRK
jgi:hypothetical protein